jgi:aspartyl-tRNA(Asn)/glutamyl-tRNA(Gln) amidotransferase subunit A
VVPVNIAGIGGITLPAGASADGLPLGVHVMCDRFGEGRLFEIAKIIEENV